MVRPPCCDKVGIKKGPWTPEEDIILMGYIEVNGPGNWRMVPINTGLMRCSKSCRLRWTNYLRPGIRRGNFTPQEEEIIIRLQALCGNRWAFIAGRLNDRTDNDVKNYWNTHLKKKLKKQGSSYVGAYGYPLARCDSSMVAFNNAAQPAVAPLNQYRSSAYASNAEDILRLLKEWESRPSNTIKQEPDLQTITNSVVTDTTCLGHDPNTANFDVPSFFSGNLNQNDDLSSMLLPEGTSRVDHAKPVDSSAQHVLQSMPAMEWDQTVPNQVSPETDTGNVQAPLPYDEKWLLDQAAAAACQAMDDLRELSADCCSNFDVFY